MRREVVEVAPKGQQGPAADLGSLLQQAALAVPMYEMAVHSRCSQQKKPRRWTAAVRAHVEPGPQSVTTSELQNSSCRTRHCTAHHRLQAVAGSGSCTQGAPLQGQVAPRVERVAGPRRNLRSRTCCCCSWALCCRMRCASASSPATAGCNAGCCGTPAGCCGING